MCKSKCTFAHEENLSEEVEMHEVTEAGPKVEEKKQNKRKKES